MQKKSVLRSFVQGLIDPYIRAFSDAMCVFRARLDARQVVLRHGNVATASITPSISEAKYHEYFIGVSNTTLEAPALPVGYTGDTAVLFMNLADGQADAVITLGTGLSLASGNDGLIILNGQKYLYEIVFQKKADDSHEGIVQTRLISG